MPQAKYGLRKAGQVTTTVEADFCCVGGQPDSLIFDTANDPDRTIRIGISGCNHHIARPSVAICIEAQHNILSSKQIQIAPNRFIPRQVNYRNQFVGLRGNSVVLNEILERRYRYSCQYRNDGNGDHEF